VAVHAAFSRNSAAGPVPSRPAGTRPGGTPAWGRRDSGRTAPRRRVASGPGAARNQVAGHTRVAGYTRVAAHSRAASHTRVAGHSRAASHTRVAGHSRVASHTRVAAHSQTPDTPEAVDLRSGHRWGCTNRRPARSVAVGSARTTPAGQSSTQLTAAQRTSTGAAIARGPEVPGIHTTAGTPYGRIPRPGSARMLYVV